mgnify:CR=1 FL=1
MKLKNFLNVMNPTRTYKVICGGTVAEFKNHANSCVNISVLCGLSVPQERIVNRLRNSVRGRVHNE